MVDYLKESGVPRTSLYTGFFIENFLAPQTKPKKQEDGSYLLAIPTLPDGNLQSPPRGRSPAIRFLSPMLTQPAKNFLYPASQTGAWVLRAFLSPAQWLNKDMRIVTEWLSLRDLANIASRVSGKKVVPMELTEEQFHQTRTAGYPGAEEFYLNFLFFVKHGPESGVRDLEMTWREVPQALTWEKFVEENKEVLFP